jgi:hypothetical protein
MKSPGRPGEEKSWDMNLRHQLSISFVKEPDIHTLIFVSGTEINSILRTALRDFMDKHKHPASNHAFRQKVFLEASTAIANGGSPRFSQLPSAKRAENIDSFKTTPNSAPNGELWAVVQNQTAPESTLPPCPMPAPTEKIRAPIEMDFGVPEPMQNTFASDKPPRPSQRDKWLARHKGASA